MSLFTQSALSKVAELQKQIIESGSRTTGDSVAVAAGKIRSIPDETFNDAVNVAADAIPTSVLELPEEKQLLTSQKHTVPIIIIELSKAGFFMDEIAHKLGFESENAKATFTEYRKNARDIAKNQIAVEVLPVDRSETMASADPNEPLPIDIGERVFSKLEPMLFTRDMSTTFKVPVTAATRGKGVVSQSLSVDQISTIGTVEKWEELRNIAAAKYSKTFPTKTGNKKPAGASRITSSNYVSAVLADML